MPIQFAVQTQSQKQKQILLLVIFLIVIFATAIVVWFGVYKKELPGFAAESLDVVPPRPVNISFSVFGTQFFKDLVYFEEIQPYDEEVGRDNPFVPSTGAARRKAASSTVDIIATAPASPATSPLR